MPQLSVVSCHVVLAEPSTDKVQPIGDVLRKNIGIHHHDDPNDGRKRDRMPEDEAEDGTFVAHLIGRGRGDADRST